MDAGLVVAVVLGVAFAVTNGFHDASNSIAALVATRAATPLQAIVLASVFNLLGPLLVGAAVANTIGGIVRVTPSAADQVIGAALAAAVAWNLATWSRGLPSSSAQALVGGLVGAALAEGGVDAVNWGGVHGGEPVGVLGTLVSLALSPPLGALGALLVIRVAQAARAAGDAEMGHAGSWRTVGDGGLVVVQPRRQRRPEVGWRDLGAAARERQDRFACGSDVGHRRVRGGADRRHGAGGMADHSHRGPRDLSPPADRGLGVNRRVGRGHLRGVAGGGADVHLTGGRLVGRRRRRRPLAVAPRSLGGRPPDGFRMADHAAERWDARGRRYELWGWLT